jgi:citrate lyase gamma subunit
MLHHKDVNIDMRLVKGQLGEVVRETVEETLNKHP